MSFTIMLTVISILFQNALFVSIGSARISIFEISALILILRYYVLRRERILLNKSAKQDMIVILLFFVITIIDCIIFNGYEIQLYTEYLGLHKIGVDKLSFDISTIIVLIRFAFYWIIFEIITNYVKHVDYKMNDKNVISTIRVSVYIVCVLGVVQVLTSRGYINADFIMSIIHDKNMGAASAYYSNYTRLFSTFAEPSYCAPWMNAAIWALVYCKKDINTIERNSLISVLLVEFVLSASSAGFLSMVLMFLYYMYSNKSKKSFVLSLVIVCMAFFAYIATPIGNTISAFIGDKINSTSGLSRFAYIVDCYRVFTETYLMGVGYMKIKCMTLISGLLAQVGIIGTVSFIWIVFKKLSRKNYTNAQNVTKVFLIATLVGGEISCSGLAYLAPFWYGLLLFAMTNYSGVNTVNQRVGGV